MPLAIPIENTITAGDLPSIYDGVDAIPSPDELPPLLDNDIFVIQRVAEENVNGKVYAEGDFYITGSELRQWVTGANTMVRNWEPDTDYYTGYTDSSGINHPPEIVYHGDTLYTVNTDFTSGATFSDNGLTRLTLDKDLQYIELPFSAVGPFLPNQTLGMYNAIARSVLVKPTWNLPSVYAPHDVPIAISNFYCNPEITTNTVVTLYVLSGTGAQLTVGTITFDPINATSNYVSGTLAIVGGTEFSIDDGDILIAKLTTVSAELSWLSLNMLGQVVSVRSPEFNIPV